MIVGIHEILQTLGFGNELVLVHRIVSACVQQDSKIDADTSFYLSWNGEGTTLDWDEEEHSFPTRNATLVRNTIFNMGNMDINVHGKLTYMVKLHWINIKNRSFQTSRNINHQETVVGSHANLRAEANGAIGTAPFTYRSVGSLHG